MKNDTVKSKAYEKGYDILIAQGWAPKLINNLEDYEVCGVFEMDEYYKGRGKIDGTALCPYCGIDSIIGESSGYPITAEFLKSMHERWFN